MGKKKKSQTKKTDKYPFVSVCTPTFNRRPFIPFTIKGFDRQTYPKDRIEWIIIDDGTDKIGDLVSKLPNVKYYSYDEKMSLGKKRNLMHEKSRGDIIVYMDDDDYYPPDRISHAVDTLIKNPKALCAGSSEIYIWFKHIQKMVQFGPYGPNHATAGTFAFRKELLKQSSYDDKAALAEEKHFLKNYTIPFVQLDPLKTILVFSHIHNTFDKKKLLDNPNPKVVRYSDKKVENFVKVDDARDFYMNQIEGLLERYKPGRPEMKPDVLSQMIKIEENRRKQIEEMAIKNMNKTSIMYNGPNGKHQLSNDEVIKVIQQLQETNKQLIDSLREKNKKIQELEDKLANIDQEPFEIDDDLLSQVNNDN